MIHEDISRVAALLKMLDGTAEEIQGLVDADARENNQAGVDFLRCDEAAVVFCVLRDNGCVELDSTGEHLVVLFTECSEIAKRVNEVLVLYSKGLDDYRRDALVQ